MTKREIDLQLANLQRILRLIDLEREDFEQRLGKSGTENLIDRTLDKINSLNRLKEKLDGNDIE